VSNRIDTTQDFRLCGVALGLTKLLEDVDIEVVCSCIAISYTSGIGQLQVTMSCRPTVDQTAWTVLEVYTSTYYLTECNCACLSINDLLHVSEMDLMDATRTGQFVEIVMSSLHKIRIKLTCYRTYVGYTRVLLSSRTAAYCCILSSPVHWLVEHAGTMCSYK